MMAAALEKSPSNLTRRVTALAALTRWVLALIAIGVISLGILMVQDLVDHFAVHLCGWPARSQCDMPVHVWSLVTIWFVASGVVAGLALLAWAWTGRNGLWAWGLVFLVVLCPMLGITVKPLPFGVDDLLLFGLNAGLVIEFVRRLLLDWFPSRSPVINVVSAVTAVVFIAVLVALPFYLGEVGT